MEIGILALTIGAVFCAFGFAGMSNVQPPAREEKEIQYPFPEEI